MGDICGDNRFEVIAKAKKHLLESTNIDSLEEEMRVLDNFLFRCWQMGWLDRYDETATVGSMKESVEIITIHVDTPEGKTVSKIDVPLSELVKCYMDVHYPLSNNKNVS